VGAVAADIYARAQGAQRSSAANRQRVPTARILQRLLRTAPIGAECWRTCIPIESNLGRRSYPILIQVLVLIARADLFDPAPLWPRRAARQQHYLFGAASTRLTLSDALGNPGASLRAYPARRRAAQTLANVARLIDVRGRQSFRPRLHRCSPSAGGDCRGLWPALRRQLIFQAGHLFLPAGSDDAAPPRWIPPSGGKTGVQTIRRGKITSSAHLQSAKCRARPATCAPLRLLPQCEHACGTCGVLKYGLICDAPFFDWLEMHVGELLARDAEALTHVDSPLHAEIKAQIVGRDEYEARRARRAQLGPTLLRMRLKQQRATSVGCTAKPLAPGSSLQLPCHVNPV